MKNTFRKFNKNFTLKNTVILIDIKKTKRGKLFIELIYENEEDALIDFNKIQEADELHIPQLNWTKRVDNGFLTTCKNGKKQYF